MRNWSRFLHRLWLVATGLCIAASMVVLYANPKDSSNLANRNSYIWAVCLQPNSPPTCTAEMEARNAYRRSLNRWYWAAFHVGVTLPVASLALGYAFAWAIRGLQPKDPP